MHKSRSSVSAPTGIRCRLGARSGPLSVGGAGLLAAVAAVAALAAAAPARAAVLKVKGHYSSQLAEGPDCTAATKRCFVGKIYGEDISGSFTGGINSITPTAQADVMLVDAVTTITTTRGNLYFAHQQAVYNVNPKGRGEFSWILRITRGTGRYAGATGYLQGSGNTPPSTGKSTSTYVGEITLGGSIGGLAGSATGASAKTCQTPAGSYQVTPPTAGSRDGADPAELAAADCTLGFDEQPVYPLSVIGLALLASLGVVVLLRRGRSYDAVGSET